MSVSPIGGYFEWEFPLQLHAFPHEDGVLLNSNRSALQVIIQSIGKIGNLYVPYYTCDSVVRMFDGIGVKYAQYHIDRQLRIANPITLDENDYLIYVNYFGVMDDYCKELAGIYGSHLIVDNAQALYSKHIPNTHSAYSVRKFIGVPDGGIAISDVVNNDDVEKYPISRVDEYCGALLARAEGDVTKGYKLFHENDSRYHTEGVRRMSQLSKKILRSLDHDEIVRKRKDNYNFLHQQLGKRNGLNLPATCDAACPLVYPFFCDDASLRDRLIAEKVFVARYWPNVLEWCSEEEEENILCRHIMALPIDQRYGIEEMKRIIDIIQSN